MLKKIILYNLFREFGFPVLTPFSITVVTSNRCNSLCKTCEIGKIYHENKKQVIKKELTLQNYKKIFSTLGKIQWATIGGGEPFLREDFKEIVLLVNKYNSPKIINIPTNATMPSTISNTITDLLSSTKKTRIIVNLSLDGIGEKHDIIRGYKHNFKLFEKTLNKLKSIKDQRFTIGINTIMSKYNQDDFDEILEYIKKKAIPDSYIIEIAQKRSEFYNEKLSFFPDAKKTKPIIEKYISYLNFRKVKRIPKLIKSFRLNYYKKYLDHSKGHRCFSGFSSCHLTYDGDVWSNSSTGNSFGNLREYNFDFAKLWKSKKANNLRKRLRMQKCSCQLSNISYPNTVFNFVDLINVSKEYLKK